MEICRGGNCHHETWCAFNPVPDPDTTNQCPLCKATRRVLELEEALREASNETKRHQALADYYEEALDRFRIYTVPPLPEETPEEPEPLDPDAHLLLKWEFGMIPQMLSDYPHRKLMQTQTTVIPAHMIRDKKALLSLISALLFKMEPSLSSALDDIVLADGKAGEESPDANG